MRNNVLLIFILLFLTSCVIDIDEEVERTGGGRNGLFYLIDDNGRCYRPFLTTDGEIHIVVDSNTNLTNLLPVFTADKNYAAEAIDCSDFVNPITIKETVRNVCGGGYTIILYNLPVLLINTPNGEEIVSKKERLTDCELKFVQANGIIESLGTAGIKVRGNSTAEQAKKPYNIKLDKKQSVLGMNASKNWVLLANPYYDRTQLHNATAFEIARLTDYSWVQSGHYVELIINGEHRGLYYICEKVDFGKGKIETENISATASNDATILDSYLIESDVYWADQKSKERYTFSTNFYNRTGSSTRSKPGFSMTLAWCMKNPDKDITNDQIDYIATYMNKVESLIYDDNLLLGGWYRDYFDIESAINWWLTEELCCNEEAVRTKNLYLYKKCGDNKIYFGPPWDFDALTFGYAWVEQLWVKNTAYCFRQLLTDPYFKKRVKEKWNIYKPIWEEQIPNFIDEQYKLIYHAAKRNEVMWAPWEYQNKYPTKTYEELIIEMKDSFMKQLNYMDDIFSEW